MAAAARDAVRSSRLTRRPPSPAAAPHGHPCHSHGPARFPSSWAVAPAPSKPPTSHPVALPRLRIWILTLTLTQIWTLTLTLTQPARRYARTAGYSVDDAASSAPTQVGLGVGVGVGVGLGLVGP